MKQILNDYYLDSYPKDFKDHFRNDFGFNPEYISIFDSITKFKGSSQFHYDNTMIPPERFERLLHKMERIHLDELIRLAIIGYKHEKNTKTNGHC